MRTGWGFAGKGTKILRHYGTKKWLKTQHQGHGEDLKVGSTREWLCHHAELVSASVRSEIPKQVRNDICKKCAFTLSEVLIVLAVLGVVAAMTIPDLIQDYREKALITALKKNYSIFSQAVDMAIAENGPPNTWDIETQGSPAGALKLYDILKPYLKIEKTCGFSSGCFANHYEALFNTKYAFQPETMGSFAKGVLASGASFHTWPATTGCPGGYCGYIGVDVNGKSAPNKAGVDYFYFLLIPDGLLPMGQKIVFYPCKYDYTHTQNGPGCAYWAIKHENMDYLRKNGDYTKYY